ncbi:MAG: carboxypeptidase-like regulatory domain-containing protein [Acidobacteriota bacterium]|nr:carboxypeptidase-like regulatory domain-containing protein [Acidobacteriota bacterium]
MTVTGLVTVAGQPGNGRLIWHSEVENPQSEGVMRTLGGPVQRTQVVSSKLELAAPIDQEGRYRLESMISGEWGVILWSENEGWQQRREVTVPDVPCEEVVLDFHYGGVSIDGFVVDPEGQPVTHATVDIFPGRRAVVTGRNGRYETRDLTPGAYQLRARFQHSRSDLVDVELRDYNDRQSVRLDLRDDPSDDELVIRLAGAAGGFCFVEMEGTGQRTVRIDRGVASTQLTPPLTDRVRVACQADGRWVLTGWHPLEPALGRGIELDPFESESSIVLTGEPSTAAVQVTGPGGWDLGSLRIWFGGATVFDVGETISNLPEGEYTLRWGNQVRTVWTERRRAAEIEIE